MKFVRNFIDKIKPKFEKGGKFEKFYYIFEAHETLLFVPNHTTNSKGVQVRDAIDMKRMMMTVIIAMIPCLLFGMWNVGYQHFLAVGEVGSFWNKFLLGAQLVLPIVVVSYATGLTIEFTFATIRKHPINEGFLVTGMLIPLIVPVTIPLWQVALATIFAVVIGKEAFGGTGMNILNVAMTARAFLYFAYPSQITGDVWVYLGGKTPVDGYTGSTVLSSAAETSASNQAILDKMVKEGVAISTETMQQYGVTDVISNLQNVWAEGLYELKNLFLGTIPGSIGETSTLMCLIGAAILIITGVGSWKIIVSLFAGTYLTGLLFNLVAPHEFHYMTLPAYYHLVIGGLAFGAVFMATDPVTAAQTERGKWIYGFLIGAITVLIRVLNPGYPEGIMLAVLLMNVFAPLIDYYVVQANKKRRLKRATV